jgi:hypothetical protein
LYQWVAWNNNSELSKLVLCRNGQNQKKDFLYSIWRIFTPCSSGVFQSTLSIHPYF